MKLGEAVYKSQQKDTSKEGAQQNKGSESKDKNKDNVVDADFEEVKEDKNDKDKEDKEKSA
jgi:molecular chaperone DnaK